MQKAPVATLLELVWFFVISAEILNSMHGSSLNG